MSNLSTLPKGDSAWLLRKAIQRITQQVSVLETNIGASTTGNSLDKQVIFNDNGVLRGDTGLQFNPATDTLQAGLLIVPGNTQLATVGTLYVGTILNPKLKVDVAGTGVTTITEATITGDLTVDTNVLKVDSTNNRVGIGTASPSYNLHSVITSGYAGAFRSSTAVVGGILCGNTVGDLIVAVDASGNGRVTADTSKYLGLGSNGINDRAILDSSGNLGLGVTPSAWATLRGLQNGRANLVGYVSNAEGAWLTNNAFYDGSWKYQTSAQASHYQQLSGVHSWSIAGTDTAGNPIAFTQAMTLDASGNLALGQPSASYRLDVLGSATISGRFKTSGALNALYLEDAGTTAGSLYIGTSGNEFRVITGSNVALAIDVNRSFSFGATSLATTATDGFLYIPGCAGAPTGVPTAKGGRIPMVVDTTNNRFYMYVSGAWKYAALV